MMPRRKSACDIRFMNGISDAQAIQRKLDRWVPSSLALGSSLRENQYPHRLRAARSIFRHGSQHLKSAFFEPSPMWGQDMKTKLLLLLSILLFAVAISGTLLGGMVLAFDKSLWPIDGYVLYIGQYSHVLLVPVSAYALTVCHKEKSSKLQQFTLFVLLVLAIIPLIVIPNSMFVYGIWPS